MWVRPCGCEEDCPDDCAYSCRDALDIEVLDDHLTDYEKSVLAQLIDDGLTEEEATRALKEM